jgi:hypothetical protein
LAAWHCSAVSLVTVTSGLAMLIFLRHQSSSSPSSACYCTSTVSCSTSYLLLTARTLLNTVDSCSVEYTIRRYSTVLCSGRLGNAVQLTAGP